MLNRILINREVKEYIKWDPHWPRGKIKRPREMLIDREIKKNAIGKKKKEKLLIFL